MVRKDRSTIVIRAFSRLVAAIVTGSVIMSACWQGRPQPLSFASTPTSLLFVKPLIGAEQSLGDPLPVPERIVIDEESVLGWLSPREKSLRFPVDLREGARLSFRIGAAGESEFEEGDLVASVEYRPYDESGRRFGEVHKFDEAEIVPDRWTHVDIDLAEIVPGRGELCFRLDGPKSGDTDIKTLWGQPTVYYPAERLHRNVLLIGIDTLRSDGLSVYGGRVDVSPNVDLLSREATIFTRAWSQAPWTVPSFESMITGLYPSEIAPTLSTEQLPESATPIAELLLPKGFTTGMICGNAYVGNPQSGFQQGMEGLWFRNNAEPGDSVAKAMEFIDRSVDRDWFLFLHIMDPHGPYDPPRQYIDSLCDPVYSGKYRTEFTDGLEWQLAAAVPAQSDINRVRCLYDAEVSDVDSAIADLYSYLRERNLLDDTLIILAADHGEEFFEHGQFEHGQSLNEEMVHLPLIAWGADFPDGARIDTPVANFDIAASIMRHLQQPTPENFHGVALQDVVSGEGNGERVIMGEGNLRRSTHCKFAVEWPYKCILDFFTGEARLYDLVVDPMESTDISGLHPELIEPLSTEMILAMPPIRTTFVLAMIGDAEGGPGRFSGSINAPGGAGFVQDSGFLEGDSFAAEGETIDFDFSTEIDPEEPIKALVIVPLGDTIEATVLADRNVAPDRFYPYASSTPEPDGSATVNVYDLPWPARIPSDARDRPVGLYIIGIPGYPADGGAPFERTELDPETREALRALGYVN